ncbi:MAG: hypothetical protein ACRDPY_22745 [Streptosporangiaceae bacterium]
MSNRVVRAGLAGGLVGGLVMAGFAMVMMWLAGSGFWTPVNLIAHTFWRSAPLDGRFSLAAAVIGVAVHMLVATMFATVIAAGACRLPGRRSLVIAGGIVFTAVLWPVMQDVVWHALDAAAAGDFTTWVFASAHLVFGAVAASMAAIAVPDADATPPRHALPRQPAQPRSWFTPSGQRR